MKLAVISSSPLIVKDKHCFAYGPYINEMVIWAKHVDEIAFLCPILKDDDGLLLAPIPFKISKVFVTKDFNIKSIGSVIFAFLHSFWNFYQIFKIMFWADHIHLRCPGNIGLMGCIVQFFFPSKPKTAKYAGNWDPKSKQPRSYKLQQWILSNTFLTRNMQVLVYGEWVASSRNIKPFFTATYTEADKIEVIPRKLNITISMIFVGTLTKGKRPLYAIQLVETLRRKGIDINLSLYGNGQEKDNLQQYIDLNQLNEFVFMKGNFSKDEMKKVYQEAHFMILPSESEGWPKVVAEAMFWGCLPIATKVSCVPNMLDYGNRGLLLSMNESQDAAAIFDLIQNESAYQDKVEKSMLWSRNFTLDLFGNEIKNLLLS